MVPARAPIAASPAGALSRPQFLDKNRRGMGETPSQNVPACKMENAPLTSFPR
jgi:hypothetical protein